LVASLCQYASLHVDFYAAEMADAIRDAASVAGFVEVGDAFAASGSRAAMAISRRALRV
jgi:hypothetical protein